MIFKAKNFWQGIGIMLDGMFGTAAGSTISA